MHVCLTRIGLIHVCALTHLYVWHDSFICVTWFVHMCDIVHSYSSHDAFMCVTWLIHTCDLTCAYVWHDALIRVTRLVHTETIFNCLLSWFIRGDMTHVYVWYDSCICVIWRIHTHEGHLLVSVIECGKKTGGRKKWKKDDWKLTFHLSLFLRDSEIVWGPGIDRLGRFSCICMNESCHPYEWVMSHVYEWSCHTYMNESCHTYECAMSHISMNRVTHTF